MDFLHYLQMHWLEDLMDVVTLSVIVVPVLLIMYDQVTFWKELDDEEQKHRST